MVLIKSFRENVISFENFRRIVNEKWIILCWKKKK